MATTEKTSSSFDTYNEETQRYEFDPEKAEAYFKKNAYVDEDGVVIRWKSNKQVPPRDCLYAFLLVGKITENQFTVSCEERAYEAERAIQSYKESRARHGYSDEERFEMRAAFGPGAEVVDIFTGKKIKV